MDLLYHTQQDLVDIRSDILSYGRSDFNHQMQEAEDIVDRAIESNWYRGNAENFGLDWRSTRFDRTKLTDPKQLKRVSCYKSLQLVYMVLAKESPEPDGFERNSKNFQRLYAEEMNEVLNYGLNYDWNADDELGTEETFQPQVRRQYKV